MDMVTRFTVVVCFIVQHWLLCGMSFLSQVILVQWRYFCCTSETDLLFFNENNCLFSKQIVHGTNSTAHKEADIPVVTRQAIIIISIICKSILSSALLQHYAHHFNIMYLLIHILQQLVTTPCPLTCYKHLQQHNKNNLHIKSWKRILQQVVSTKILSCNK